MSYYEEIIFTIFLVYVTLSYLIRSSYEKDIQKQKDKKLKYKFTKINLNDHKQYLLKYIEQMRMEEKEYQLKAKKTNEELTFQLITLNQSYVEKRNKISELQEKLRKVTEEKNRIYVENQQRLYELNKVKDRYTKKWFLQK